MSIQIDVFMVKLLELNVRDDFIKRYNSSKDGYFKESQTTTNTTGKIKTKQLTDEEIFNLSYFGGDD